MNLAPYELGTSESASFASILALAPLASNALALQLGILRVNPLAAPAAN